MSQNNTFTQKPITEPIRKFRLIDALMLAETGQPLTDEQLSELYRQRVELEKFLAKQPKKTFVLTKEDGERGHVNRVVTAKCMAEVAANRANKGWEITPDGEFELAEN